MEKTKNYSNSKAKALLAVIGTLAALLFITCVTLRVTPLVISDSILHFAEHHYFLTGFISLTIAVACWKMYTSLDEKIETRFQKKSISFISSAEHKAPKGTIVLPVKNNYKIEF